MTDIKLVEKDPETGVLRLEASSKTVDGIDELIQIVFLSLLNVSGKDVLHPNKGGGIPAMIGYNISDENELFASIAEAVSKTEREVLEDQVGLDLNVETKLKELKIKSIDVGENEDTVLVSLQIINEVGRIAEVTI